MFTSVPEEINVLSQKVITLAYKVHTALGPGLLESAYKECLSYEIARSGVFVLKEKALPLIYDDIRMEAGYRVDLMIENKLIVEIKSVELLTDVHSAQVLTYLKLSGCRVGLLFNFNVVHLKSGIRRLII